MNGVQNLTWYYQAERDHLSPPSSYSASKELEAARKGAAQNENKYMLTSTTSGSTGTSVPPGWEESGDIGHLSLSKNIIREQQVTMAK